MSRRLVASLLPAVWLFVWACGSAASESPAPAEVTLSIEEAYAGACGSCHLLPDPGDLTRELWAEVVLPRMGQFLGHYATPTEREELLAADPEARARLEAMQVYPAHPTVDAATLAAIREYILARAPDSLVMPRHPRGAPAALRPRFPDVFLSPPSSTYVAVPPEGGILLADINKGSLFAFSGALEVQRRIEVGSGLTDIQVVDGLAIATVLGSFSPTDAGLGQLVAFTSEGTQVVGEGLRRPTSLLPINLDADPELELVVTEFGKWTGGLSRWDRQSDGRYARSELSNQTGAMQVVGVPGAARPTFFVLYAQGREEVARYSLAADGSLARESVLRFPPSYGSSSLRLVDWDGDGIDDLLYTAGDGADYVSAPKPYHGVRIFRGAADGSYAEALFLPLPGAYDAEVGDFDGDGDRDVAAVSFFPDYRAREPLSAVLFENTGDGRWPARVLPGSERGRFIRLAAGDIDGDGRPELVGSTLAMEPVPDDGRLASWVAQGLPFVVWGRG